MKDCTKLVFFVITLSSMTAIVPEVLAQVAQGDATRSAVASQLGVFVVPKNNQDQVLQAKDENECYNSAKQQSGIDPNAPPPAPQEAKQQKGGAVKGAAKGAVGGAAIGAITDNDNGAAVGATAGAVRGRRQQKKANKEAEQQAQQKTDALQQQSKDTFNKAFSACLGAREYSVK